MTTFLLAYLVNNFLMRSLTIKIFVIYSLIFKNFKRQISNPILNGKYQNQKNATGQKNQLKILYMISRFKNIPIFGPLKSVI